MKKPFYLKPSVKDSLSALPVWKPYKALIPKQGACLPKTRGADPGGGGPHPLISFPPASAEEKRRVSSEDRASPLRARAAAVPDKQQSHWPFLRSGKAGGDWLQEGRRRRAFRGRSSIAWRGSGSCYGSGVAWPWSWRVDGAVTYACSRGCANAVSSAAAAPSIPRPEGEGRESGWGDRWVPRPRLPELRQGSGGLRKTRLFSSLPSGSREACLSTWRVSSSSSFDWLWARGKWDPRCYTWVGVRMMQAPKDV